MAKTRILSLLLATLMVLPCLPVTASASAAPANTPVGVNLLTADLTNPANWTLSNGQTASQIKVSDPDGNGSNTYLKMNGNLTNGAMHWLKFDNSVVSGGFPQGNYVAKIQVSAQVDGSEVVADQIRMANCNGATIFQPADVGNTASYITTDTFATRYSGQLLLGFRGGNNVHFVTPKIIDNISIYKSTDLNTPVYTFDFENPSKTGVAAWKYLYDPSTGTGYDINGQYNNLANFSDAEIVTEYDHLRVNKKTDNTSGEVAYTPASALTLTPGKYELTFDARQSYYFNNATHNSAVYASENAGGILVGDYSTGATTAGSIGMFYADGTWAGNTPSAGNYGWYKVISNLSARYHILHKGKYGDSNATSLLGAIHANYRDVSLALATNKALSNVKLDGADFGGKFHVTDSWDSYKLTFDVNETTSLSSLSFGGTGKAYDNDSFDLSRISLKLVSPFSQKVIAADSENFLDNATEFYNGAVYTQHDKNTANGYITISQRDWFVNGTYAQTNQDMFAVSTGGTYDANYSYYMQFDARNHVPSNGRQNFSVRFCEVIGTKPDSKTQVLASPTEWQTFVFSHPMNDSTCANKTLRFRVERSTIWGQTSDPITFWAGIPVDFDNVIIWKEAAGGDGVYTEADKANVLYSADFNSKDTKYDKDIDVNYWLTGGVLVKTALYSHNFENDFGRLSVSADNVTPVLSYTDLNNGEGHGEGVYAFKAQLRTHYNFVNMRYNPTAIGTYNTSNNHKANITFTMTPTDGGADETITRTVDVNYLWSEFSAALTVEKGYKLTKIEITPVFNTAYAIPAAARGLDFANVYLGYYNYETIETEDNKNYLANTTVYTENAVPEQITVTDTNGYVYVSERGTDSDSPLAILVNGKITNGVTYYIEYDIRVEGAGPMEIRPRLTTNKSAGVRLAGNRATADGHFQATADSGLATFDASSDGKAEPSWYLSNLESGVDYHFKGSFVPQGNYSNFYYVLRRGRNAKYTHAIYIDNFRIYDENGVDVCNYDFQNDGDIDLISKPDPSNTSYEAEHILPVDHALYTPMDTTAPMKLTYDIQLTNEEAVEGKYAFKVLARLAEETDKPARICVSFNYNDGSAQYHYMDLTSRWTTIGLSGWLDRLPDLESVTLTIESDVPVQLTSPILTIRYKYQYGKPNSGIVMVLIKKMQGKMTDPWRGLA